MPEELNIFNPSGEQEERAEYQIDEPLDLRPDLTLLGIEEVDKGVC